ncbi:MAG: flagellar filament capping protein FliD [Rhodothermaceae bacterium]|nr:flagellar filament capping protein FliD [Rhodothermaceae bacterium]
MLISSTSAAFRESDPYELLIQQLIFLESQPKFDLENRVSSLESSKNILTELDTKLQAFDDILDDFLDPLSHPFDEKSITLNDTSAFTASATDDAVFGSHTLQVSRLATVDTRLSDQHTSSATSIVTALGTGAKSFSLSVANPTDADADNRETINVSVTLSGGETDETVLENIASAINSAMLAADDAGTIDTANRAYASEVNETSDTARLSIRSGQTGYSNRINFESDTDGLLAQIGISNASVVSGATGGQVKTVGTSEDTSDLTSELVLDGLTLYRNTNQVTDALEGVTLNLSQTNNTDIEFSVAPDSSGIEAEIEDFIDKYNDILTEIRTRSTVDSDTGIRGEFAGDTTFTSLRFNLREDIITEVSSQGVNSPSQITDIGIDINSNGTLKLDDVDQLIQAIEEDPENVRTLFAASDGIAQRLSDRLADYLGFGGLISDRQENLDTRTRTLNRRIVRFDDALERRENTLREEFARLQESIELLQGQSFSFSAFS